MSLTDFSNGESADSEIEGPLQITERGLRLPEPLRDERQIVFRTPVATINSYLKREGTRRDPYQSSVKPGDYDDEYLEGDGRTVEIRNAECLSDDGYKIGVLVAGGEQHWFDVEVVDEAEADDQLVTDGGEPATVTQSPETVEIDREPVLYLGVGVFTGAIITSLAEINFALILGLIALVIYCLGWSR